MPKTKISEFSATPGNNTDIDGINISEGCAPSGINDAIRELMAQLKDFQSGGAGDSMTAVGTLAAKGTSSSGADLQLYEDTDNGTNYVALKAPSSIASNVTWTLPSADGTNGQALITNGSGTLSFATISASPGGSTTQVQYNNAGAFAGSANLTFDGSNLGVGATTVAARVDIVGSTDNQFRLSSNETNATTKEGKFLLRHYTNAQPNFLVMYPYSTSTDNAVFYGGGSSAQTAATFHAWMTAANNTTVSGTERMRLDSSGNLGIGVTPSFKLDISGSGTTAKINTLDTHDGGASLSTWLKVGRRAGTGTNAYINTLHSGSDAVDALTFAFGTTGTGTECVRITSGGDVGIGNSSPQAKLHVGSSTEAPGYGVTSQMVYVNGTSQPEVLVRETNSDVVGSIYAYASYVAVRSATVHPLVFFTSNSERARIDTNGTLLINTSARSAFISSSTKLQVNCTGSDYAAYLENTNSTPYGLYIRYGSYAPNNTGASYIYCDDSSAQRFSVRSNGGVYNYQANDSNLSDRREKTNFAPAKAYLDTICAIPVQTFNYIDQSEDDPGLTLGVVAQDVQAVAPELVQESNWGTKDNPKLRLSVYQTDLQYALMKCIQELKAQNDELRQRVAVLEAK